MKETAKAHLLMILLLCAWGFDYVPAKYGLSVLTPMQLVFFRYMVGAIVVAVIMLIKKIPFMIKKKDIPLFIICALFGQVAYFWCEYTALEMMQASLISIVLSLMPVVSIGIERVVFKRKTNGKIIAGSLVCVFGVILVMGGDFGILLTGRGYGYILCFAAVLLWNVYNHITASLEGYNAFAVTFVQMFTATLLLLPAVIISPPEFNAFTPMVIGGIIYIGIVDGGLGLLVLVYVLQKLGATTSALYSDFLPVTTAIFGWAFLHESINSIQLLGGIVVIAAGYIVIKEKGKSEELEK